MSKRNNTTKREYLARNGGSVLILWGNSMYEQRKKENPDKEPDMSDVMYSIQLKSRDNARTPMQWDTSPNSGFTGAGVTPWLKMNERYTDLNVYTQERDPDSVLNYYRKLVLLRKQHPLLVSLTSWNRSVEIGTDMRPKVLRRLCAHQPDAQADLFLPARAGAFPDAGRVQLLQRGGDVRHPERDRHRPGGVGDCQLPRHGAEAGISDHPPTVGGEGLYVAELELAAGIILLSVLASRIIEQSRGEGNIGHMSFKV